MKNAKIKNIDFYYSIGSRYSYLASTQINALEQETGYHVDWHPINSVRLIAQRKNNPFEGKPVSGQYEWTYRELDAKRWAKFYGVPYLEPRGRISFDSELLALSCTVAKCFGKVEEYSRSLFSAMFQDSLSEINETKCITLAESCGISSIDFKLALKAKDTVKQLDKIINTAIHVGVFGVPTFIASGELFWGNDRIILLSHYLNSQRNSK